MINSFMTQISKYTIGLRFGLLAGLLYIILLFIRYKFFNTNPIGFGLFALVSYFIILLMYLFTGIARKKELGGYGDLKEIFQSIFIAILIAELVYIVFNFIYLKFVDPAFWLNLKAASLSFYQKKGMTDEQIDQAMKGFKDVDKTTKPDGLIKGFGYSVIIDSVFGIIFALILRRKKLVPDEIVQETQL